MVVGGSDSGCRRRHRGARHFHALMQNDVKRVLAYSTIENIGVIFAGLGLALAFDTNGWPAAGAWL